jgi:hypothetical protein
MLPRFCVASTKPECALDRSQGISLGKGEGVLRRRVIAGQKQAFIAWRGTGSR